MGYVLVLEGVDPVNRIQQIHFCRIGETAAAAVRVVLAIPGQAMSSSRSGAGDCPGKSGRSQAWERGSGQGKSVLENEENCIASFWNLGPSINYYYLP